MVEKLVLDYYKKIYKSSFEKSKIKWLSKEHIKMLREEPEYLLLSVVIIFMAMTVIIFEKYMYWIYIIGYIIIFTVLIISHIRGKDKSIEEKYKKLCLDSIKLKQFLSDEFGVDSKEEYTFILEETRKKDHTNIFKKALGFGIPMIVSISVFFCQIIADMYGAGNGLLVFALILDAILFLCGASLIIYSFVKNSKRRCSVRKLEEELVFLIAMDQ